MSLFDRSHITNHPCFSDNRDNLWHRIHLPVASKCNVKCVFCSHTVGASCHTSKPGQSNQLMSPKVATARAISEIRKDSRVRIVAVSGPGEPLANPETFETIEIIRENLDAIQFCLSTNGTLLEENVPWLVNMGFKNLTVSMSTAKSSTASKIYEWARVGENILTGERMGSIIVDAQLRGISKAADAGITVKVNSILIPTVNQDDIIALAEIIEDAGASLQNIVPLVPNDLLHKLKPPGNDLLETMRSQASRFINQFRHCKQCRSDVVGLPGCDVIL